MKILRLEVVRVRMALRAPYRIAYQTLDHADNVFVQLVTDGPHVGLGCAAPDADVTGESVEDAERALRGAAPGLGGADPRWRSRILEELGLERTPAARAAIQMAFLDVVAKAAGLPVLALLGGFRESLPTSITLGIDAPERMVAEAKQRAAEGFRALKIKGGLDPERDARVVGGIRAAVGPAVALRSDANQGYTEADARRFLALTVDADLELLEQPTRRGTGILGRVTRDAVIPVMADESLLDLADAFRVARGELADMINIKLMKVGGIDVAMAVDSVARAAGLDAMVGCMDESALAVSAGLHFALSRRNVALADLDGHLDLVGDPADGAVVLADGALFPHPDPGLGVARLPCFE